MSTKKKGFMAADREHMKHQEVGPPIYESLPPGSYFRILVLHPGQYDDDIRCELKVQSHRRAKHKYAAISYVWGDPKDVKEVTCNNVMVPVTRNLEQALRRFRHPRTIRRLWADALCINQMDLEEKSIQVSSMGRVFRDAMKVLVWLGEDHTDDATQCFDTILKTNGYLDNLFEKHKAYYTAMPGLDKAHPIPVDKAAWTSFDTFVKLPWFSRAWTIQECALARDCKMFWGSQQIDIAEVYEISHWCENSGDLIMIVLSHGFKRFGNLYSDFRSIHCSYETAGRWQKSKPGLAAVFKTEPPTFTHVLHAGRSYKATDPRDHVFAFLECPLAQVGPRDAIIDANYFLTKEELWLQVACKLLEHPVEGPWLLSAVKHGGRDVIAHSHRPSWVPYWDELAENCLRADPYLGFEAGGPLNRFAARCRRGTTLQVAGFTFDSVAWRSASFARDAFILPRFQDEKTTMKGEPSVDKLWREISLAIEDQGHTLDEDAFSLTLKEMSPFPKSYLRTHRRQWKAYRETVRAEYRAAAFKDEQVAVDEKTLADAIGVMEVLNLYTSGRCFFLTGSGRLGLADGNLVEVGDLCCIFSGATVPFLLTPAADRHHKLVDECYIYGVMCGELVDEYEPGPILLN